MGIWKIVCCGGFEMRRDVKRGELGLVTKAVEPAGAGDPCSGKRN